MRTSFTALLASVVGIVLAGQALAQYPDKPLRMVRQLWPDPENWIGQRVRVRGYVDIWNGLFVEWDFPQQLCFIDEVPYKL